MTLRDLFTYLTANPALAVIFLLMTPALACLVNLWAGETAQAIWKWRFAYAGLVYAVCIPGVLAVTLNIYLFLFERQPIWDTNWALQLLPILTMIGTLMLIRQKIPFQCRALPGRRCGKLSGFLTLIAALIGLMWFFDRLRLVAFTYVPFGYRLLL